LWNIASGKGGEISKFPSHITALVACPGTSLIACGDDTGGIHVGLEEAMGDWTVRSLEQLHAKEITSLAFSADGKRLVSGSKDGKVVVWDVVTGKQDQTLDKSSAAVRAVAMSSEGQRAAAGDDDGRVFSWNLSDGSGISGKPHSKSVTCIAQTDDGRYVFSGSKDGAIWRNDVQDPKNGNKKCGALDSEITTLALDPEARHLYSADRHNKIIEWSLGGTMESHVLAGTHDLIFSLAVSPNAKWILSGEAGGKLVLTPIPQQSGANPK
jgi:WD40 repeat protein